MLKEVSDFFNHLTCYEILNFYNLNSNLIICQNTPASHIEDIENLLNRYVITLGPGLRWPPVSVDKVKRWCS